MEKQFDHLKQDDINPNKEYHCSGVSKSTGFNLPMKYALLGQYTLLEQHLTTNNVNHTNTKGWTSLMLACRNSNKTSNIDTVRLLLEYKANINLENSVGYTALLAACSYSNTESSIDIVKLLLEYKADINQLSRSGWTPLMAVCRFSNTISSNETVKLLLDHKADVNLQNDKGYYPLFYACIYCGTDSNNDTIKLLLDNNSSPIKDPKLLKLIYTSKDMQLDILGELLSRIVY